MKKLIVSFLKYDQGNKVGDFNSHVCSLFISSVFSVVPVLGLDSAPCDRSQIISELTYDFIVV